MISDTANHDKIIFTGVRMWFLVNTMMLNMFVIIPNTHTQILIYPWNAAYDFAKVNKWSPVTLWLAVMPQYVLAEENLQNIILNVNRVHKKYAFWGVIKTYMSNLVRTTRLWNNPHQVTLSVEIFESQIICLMKTSNCDCQVVLNLIKKEPSNSTQLLTIICFHQHIVTTIHINIQRKLWKLI